MEKILLFVPGIWTFQQASQYAISWSYQNKSEGKMDFIHTESMGFAYLLDHKTKFGEEMIGGDKSDTIKQLISYLSAKKATLGIEASEEDIITVVHLSGLGGWFNSIVQSYCCKNEDSILLEGSTCK
jgi:hypothetical protein